ncbi:MAG: transposase [Planctomycetaceae bacterium]
MIMVADSLPGLKVVLGRCGLKVSAAAMAARLIAAFTLHSGRMSCLRAATSVRGDSRHRAQVGRFLAKWSSGLSCVGDWLRAELLRYETSLGTYVFVVDATLCGQAGKLTENTYSTGNRQRRLRKGRRYGGYRHHRRSCHAFTAGLLLTPSGLRIPVLKPHYTQSYCKTHGITHRTTAEVAADMVRGLKVPAGARVIVVGDTAYESWVVREACEARGFRWIIPCNPERVLEGCQGKRVRVRSLMDDRSAWSWQTIRLVPGQGEFAAQRRLSRHRIGSKAKSRTYRVHEESRRIRSIGAVRIVFSTTKPDSKTASLDDTKILLTNASDLSVREIVDIYTLRWQIELFFKELKSSLGFHQYRFKRFTAVEGWASAAITTFLYLEWYRAWQLASARLSAADKAWWLPQRIHGLCQAVRLASERSELAYVAKRLETPGGVRRMKALLERGFAAEYRAAL